MSEIGLHGDRDSLRVVVAAESPEVARLLERLRDDGMPAEPVDLSVEPFQTRKQAAGKVLVLDLAPGAGGDVGLLRGLRSRFTPSELPIVALAEKAGAGPAAAALVAGADACVPRPVDLELASAVVLSRLRLASLDASRARLMRMLRHELGNHMTKVSTGSTLLVRRLTALPDDVEAMIRLAEVVSQGAAAIAELLNDVRVLERASRKAALGPASDSKS